MYSSPLHKATRKCVPVKKEVNQEREEWNAEKRRQNPQSDEGIFWDDSLNHTWKPTSPQQSKSKGPGKIWLSSSG